MEFADFLKALQIQKKREKSKGAEQDIIDAFVAMGGQPDKSGFINAEALRKVRLQALSFALALDPCSDYHTFSFYILATVPLSHPILLHFCLACSPKH
jgi:hypothetical protein